MLISILIPSYNRPEYLKQTIESALESLSDDVEIIVSDDNSPNVDGIKRIAAEYANCRKVLFNFEPENLGWSRNRNRLVDLATGEYVILLGDDDLLTKNALERLKHWIKKIPSLDILGFGYQKIDADGIKIETRRSLKFKSYKILGKNDWIEIVAFDAIPMWSHHPFTMLIRRELVKSIRYNPNVGIGDDHLFLIEAIGKGCTFYVIPEVLFKWRVPTTHKTNYTSLSGTALKSSEAKWLIWLHLIQSIATPLAIRRLIFSEKFLSRFLQIPRKSAASILTIYQTKGIDAVKKHAISGADFKFRISYQQKFLQLVRRIIVLGPSHLIVALSSTASRVKYKLRR